MTFEVPPALIPYLLMPGIGPVAAIGQLMLIEAEVAGVLKTLEEQIEVIKKQRFTSDGRIPVTSFGQGVESSVLGNEHTRAHGVIVDSLEEMVTDLTTYQTAIADAKKLILTSDEQAEADLQLLLSRASDLELGWDGPTVPATDENGGTP